MKWKGGRVRVFSITDNKAITTQSTLISQTNLNLNLNLEFSQKSQSHESQVINLVILLKIVIFAISRPNLQNLNLKLENLNLNLKQSHNLEQSQSQSQSRISQSRKSQSRKSQSRKSQSRKFWISKSVMLALNLDFCQISKFQYRKISIFIRDWRPYYWKSNCSNLDLDLDFMNLDIVKILENLIFEIMIQSQSHYFKSRQSRKNRRLATIYKMKICKFRLIWFALISKFRFRISNL
jgi:hypothetical protein